MVECPDCGADVTVSETVEQNEILTCDECGSELEVKSLNPIVLEIAPEEEEDWGQ